MSDIFAETVETLRNAGLRQRDITESLDPAVAAIHETFVRKYLAEGPQPGVSRDESIRRVAEYVTAGGMPEYEASEDLTSGPSARVFHFSHMVEQAKARGLLDKTDDAANWRAGLRKAERDRDRILSSFESALRDASLQRDKALEPPSLTSRKTRMPDEKMLGELTPDESRRINALPDNVDAAERMAERMSDATDPMHDALREAQADAYRPAPEQPNPMRDLLHRLEKGAEQIAQANQQLADRIDSLVLRGKRDPARLEAPKFRTLVAYAVQDLERTTGGGTIPMPRELRVEMKQRAVTYPELQNERMQALLQETASMGVRDAPLIRDIRAAGREIAISEDQHSPDTIGQIEVLENRLRLAPGATREAAPPSQEPPEAEPEKVEPIHAKASPGSGDAPAAKQASDQAPAAQAPNTQAQPQTIQVAQAAKQGVIGAIYNAARAPTPNGPPPWAPPPAALGERVTLFAQRLADGKTDQLIRAAERSGHVALDALDGLRAAPGAAVLGKIEAAASTEPGGMQAVMAEMRPDGRYAGLHDEFAATLQQEKGFAAALTRVIDAAGQYGTDRVAVAQDFEARRLDVKQLDARFDPADQAVGDSLSKVPGKQPGKTALDELAENAVKLIRKAMEKVREIVAPKPENAVAAAPSPSPAMAV